MKKKKIAIACYVLIAVVTTACTEAHLKLSTEADASQEASKTMATASAYERIERATQSVHNLYVCPMHPHIHDDGPGACSICKMDLVKSKSSGKRAERTTKKFSPEIKVGDITSQLMGIQTRKVVREALLGKSETVGLVTYNDDATYEMEPRAKGWIDKLYVKNEGERVKAGDKLMEFYSPEIVSAQDGYLLALKANYALAKERQEYVNQLAREKLGLFGIPDDVIEDITENGKFHQTVPLLAPQDGVLTRIDVEIDDYVTGADNLLTISDLSTVWVILSLFEHQVADLKNGDNISVTTVSMPGKEWQGKIDFIYPEADSTTNTIKVRAVVDTPQEALRPNTRVTVHWKRRSETPVLAVPSESVLPLGVNSKVIKRTEKNHFQPIVVTTGREMNGMTEILSGLEEGDEVVTVGQFLLDSESSLRQIFNGTDG